jgi:hypothetical protein
LKHGSNEAPDRGADRLAADLERIAGKAQVAHRAGAGELHRARRAAVLEDPACAAGAIEARKREHLAGYKSAGLIGIYHLPGQSGRDHRTRRDRPQHKTRKHAVTPTYRAAGNRLMSLYPLLTIRTVATLAQLGW